MLLIAMRRTQTANRREKPRMRYRRREVGAVKPVMALGTMDETTRKGTILSSQNVNELEKYAAVCKMRMTGVAFRVSHVIVGGDDIIKTVQDIMNVANRAKSKAPKPGKYEEKARERAIPTAVPPAPPRSKSGNWVASQSSHPCFEADRPE